jgi:hypothetical protein
VLKDSLHEPGNGSFHFTNGKSRGRHTARSWVGVAIALSVDLVRIDEVYFSRLYLEF